MEWGKVQKISAILDLVSLNEVPVVLMAVAMWIYNSRGSKLNLETPRFVLPHPGSLQSHFIKHSFKTTSSFSLPFLRKIAVVYI